MKLDKICLFILACAMTVSCADLNYTEENTRDEDWTYEYFGEGIKNMVFDVYAQVYNQEFESNSTSFLAGATDEAMYALETGAVNSYTNGGWSVANPIPLTWDKAYRAISEIHLYLEKIEKADISDETVQKIYDDDKDSYDTVDYLTFTFDYEDIYDVLIKDKKTENKDAKADDKKDEIDPEVKAEAIKIAKEYSEKLEKAVDLKSFEEVLKDFYVKVMKQSEETAKKTLSEGKHIVKGASYKEGDEQLSWLFGKDSSAEVKVDSVKTFTTTEKHEHKEGDDHTGLGESYTVIHVTRTRGTVEGISSVDVRHILFSTDTYKNDAEAQKISEQWKKDGAKEDDFAKLAEKYTEDTGSKFNGGLYEGVTEGQMIKEFNDWIFAKDRKAGDHGIVKTTYGWHVMYYVDGAEAWQATIKAELQSEASKKAVEAASDKYKATVDYDAINNVNA